MAGALLLTLALPAAADPAPWTADAWQSLRLHLSKGPCWSVPDTGMVLCESTGWRLLEVDRRTLQADVRRLDVELTHARRAEAAGWQAANQALTYSIRRLEDAVEAGSRPQVTWWDRSRPAIGYGLGVVGTGSLAAGVGVLAAGGDAGVGAALIGAGILIDVAGLAVVW